MTYINNTDKLVQSFYERTVYSACWTELKIKLKIKDYNVIKFFSLNIVKILSCLKVRFLICLLFVFVLLLDFRFFVIILRVLLIT